VYECAAVRSALYAAPAKREAPVCAVSQIAGETVRIQAQPGAVTLCLEKLAVWDVIALKLDKKALKGIWTG
jgi:hypothetical protein